jgi:hypothetical protein
MKRKLKWLAIVLAVSMLGLGTALLLWPRDRITVDSWQKIRIGMTEAEVEEILGRSGIRCDDFFEQYAQLQNEMGKPPFIDEGLLLEEPDFGRPTGLLFDEWDKSKIWSGRHGFVGVHFDEKGHVAKKIFHAMRPAEPGFLDRLRDWLGW